MVIVWEVNNFEVVSDSVGSPKLNVYFFMCVTEKSVALDLSFCCVLCKRGLRVFFCFIWLGFFADETAVQIY